MYEGQENYKEKINIMYGCQRCQLCNFRSNVVVYRGNPRSDVMIIGEAPGQMEDIKGKPMVGPTGSYLVRLMERNGFTLNDYYITNAILCLDGAAQVQTEEGPKRINWIVKHRWKGQVLSVTDSGVLEWRDITGWYRNPLQGRSMVKVRFKNGKANPKGHAGVRVTSDHKLLTKEGYKEARELKPGDLVATGTPSPGLRGRQILIGSMLGDGCIHNGGYSERHSIMQEEYLRLKARVLQGFDPYLTPLTTIGDGKIYKRIGHEYRYLTMGLARSLFFHDQEREWYHNGKVFPKKQTDQLTMFGLAILYMDDGYFRYKMKKNRDDVREGDTGYEIEIALGRIDDDSASNINEAFIRLGFDTYITSAGIKRLRFRYGKAGDFLRQVAQYIPPSMRYKLPTIIRASIPYREEWYYPEEPETYYSEVIVEPSTSTDKNNVYCIEVDGNHNFVTPGGVVSNCRPPNNDRPIEEHLLACSDWLNLQLELIKPKYIITAGGVATSRIIPEFGLKTGRITLVEGKTFTPIHLGGTVVIPIQHPSAIMRKGDPNKQAEYEALVERICTMIKNGEVF